MRSTGCSADLQLQSNRRTVITNAARQISKVSGSLRDVQSLEGYASLQTTQRNIEGDAEARGRVVLFSCNSILNAPSFKLIPTTLIDENQLESLRSLTTLNSQLSAQESLLPEQKSIGDIAKPPLVSL